MSIPYSKQWIDEEDIRTVVDVLRGDWITQGPTIDKFEMQIAEYIGAKHAIAFNSGTAALHAAMFAAGVKKGDSMITCPITFVATSNAGVYLGAKPTFVDIDINTYCLDLTQVKAAISANTKVIVPVDYAGYPVNLRQLRENIDGENLTIIEDAAHAFGAKRYGKMVGQEADMTMFSFHPVKHITTGEGGIIVTDNDEFNEKMRIFRTHGITKDPKRLYEKNGGSWYYEMHYLGFNYRITDIQCALGLSQLKKLNSFLIRRNQIANRYNEAFQEIDNLVPPPIPNYPNSRHAYHIYPLRLKNSDRRSVFTNLRASNIYCQVHYIPVHLHPFYRQNFGFGQGNFPIAEAFYNKELSIPLYPKMTDHEMEFVIEKIFDAIK